MGTATLVPINSAHRSAGCKKERKGVHVIASSDVVIYTNNAEVGSTDAFLAIPLDEFGTEYFVPSMGPYKHYTGDAKSQFSKVFVPCYLSMVSLYRNYLF